MKIYAKMELYAQILLMVLDIPATAKLVTPVLTAKAVSCIDILYV